MSVLFCAAGILFMAEPGISMEIIGVCIGVAMILFGIVKLIGYFQRIYSDWRSSLIWNSGY